MPFAAPLVLPALIGTGVAGTAMTYQAQREAGKSEKAWGEYEAAIGRQKAKAEEKATAYEEKQFRKEGARKKARFRVGALAGGMELTGTSLEDIVEMAGELEADAYQIRRAGIVRAQEFRSQATLARMRGGAAARAGRYRSTGTLLSGAAQAGAMGADWYAQRREPTSGISRRGWRQFKRGIG